MASSLRVLPPYTSGFQGAREPEFRLSINPDASCTQFFTAGIGMPADAAFGCIGKDGVVDPDSYSGMFPGDRHFYTKYGAEHNEPVLFDRWISNLNGEIEAHLFSAGAAIFDRFLRYCNGREVNFQVRRITYINPAIGLAGLLPAQRRTVKACRYLTDHLSGIRRSSLLQQIWGGVNFGHRHFAGWSSIWPEDPNDRALACNVQREAAYDAYRDAQRACRVQNIITASASLSLPAFAEPLPPTVPLASGCKIGMILLKNDPVLTADNLWVIRGYYAGQIVQHSYVGEPGVAGGHESGLAIRPDLYRKAYKFLIDWNNVVWPPDQN